MLHELFEYKSDNNRQKRHVPLVASVAVEDKTGRQPAQNNHNKSISPKPLVHILTYHIY